MYAQSIEIDYFSDVDPVNPLAIISNPDSQFFGVDPKDFVESAVSDIENMLPTLNETIRISVNEVDPSSTVGAASASPVRWQKLIVGGIDNGSGMAVGGFTYCTTRPSTFVYGVDYPIHIVNHHFCQDLWAFEEPNLAVRDAGDSGYDIRIQIKMDLGTNLLWSFEGPGENVPIDHEMSVPGSSYEVVREYKSFPSTILHELIHAFGMTGQLSVAETSSDCWDINSNGLCDLGPMGEDVDSNGNCTQTDCADPISISNSFNSISVFDTYLQYPNGTPVFNHPYDAMTISNDLAALNNYTFSALDNLRYAAGADVSIDWSDEERGLLFVETPNGSSYEVLLIDHECEYELCNEGCTYGVPDNALYHASENNTGDLFLMYSPRPNQTNIQTVDPTYLDLLNSESVWGSSGGGGIIDWTPPIVQVQTGKINVIRDLSTIKDVYITNIYDSSIRFQKVDINEMQTEIDVSTLPSGSYGIRTDGTEGSVFIGNYYLPN